MTSRNVRNQSVRQKQKRDPDKLATGAQNVHDKLATKAQIVPEVLPETKLKLTQDDANCSQSASAESKNVILTS